MIRYEDNTSVNHTEFVAIFGNQKMSFHSLDTFNQYLDDFLRAFPDFSIKSLKVFRVDIYEPLKPNENA